MKALLFLSNELVNPDLQKKMKLPLHFISYAMMEGKMYTHHRKRGTFVLAHRQHFPRYVYGAIFALDDFDFYIRLIDAYHICSLSTLLINHHKDIHHRLMADITPIYFRDIEEFASLKYREGESVSMFTYFANPTHPKINQRLRQTNSYRVQSGVDSQNFKKLYERVQRDANSSE